MPVWPGLPVTLGLQAATSTHTGHSRRGHQPSELGGSGFVARRGIIRPPGLHPADADPSGTCREAG